MFRVTQDHNESTMTFIDDVDGGSLVQCGNCGHEITMIGTLTYEGEDVCPECRGDLVYPGWAEW